MKSACRFTHVVETVPGQSNRAFTLIELLVVIAMIAILAGLLLPALARAKTTGQKIKCINNLDQLQLAWLIYPDDYNDKLPPNKSIKDANVEGSWVVGNAQKDTATTNIQRGVLFPYTRATGVYVCPSDKSLVVGNLSLGRSRSYALSGVDSPSEVHSSSQGWDWSPSNFISGYDTLMYHQNASPGPSKTFIFIDENEQSIDDGIFAGPFSLPLPEIWWDMPADRHNRGCNLSFADGHVEQHRWEAPRKFKQHLQPVDSTDGGKDRRDEEWLGERTNPLY